MAWICTLLCYATERTKGREGKVAQHTIVIVAQRKHFLFFFFNHTSTHTSTHTVNYPISIVATDSCSSHSPSHTRTLNTPSPSIHTSSIRLLACFATAYSTSNTTAIYPPSTLLLFLYCVSLPVSCAGVCIEDSVSVQVQAATRATPHIHFSYSTPPTHPPTHLAPCTLVTPFFSPPLSDGWMGWKEGRKEERKRGRKKGKKEARRETRHAHPHTRTLTLTHTDGLDTNIDKQAHTQT